MKPKLANQKPSLNVEELESIQHQLGQSLDQLRGAHLFLTGGTGFFGRWLVESFLHFNKALGLEARLTILSRDPESFLSSAVHLVSDRMSFAQGDIRDFTFPDCNFTHIIHAATDASDKLNSGDPLKMFDVIVNGTRHVLDFATQSGTERMLFVSSGAVYGPQPPEVTNTTEEMVFGFAPNVPENAYAEGKRAAEFLCSVFARNCNIKIPIARCFAFVGPHLPLDAHFAIGNFINDRTHHRAIRVEGDGTPLRSYLYASDMAAWLWTILLKGDSGRAYNVGSDEAISIRDLAIKIAIPAGLEVSIGSPNNLSKSRNQYVPSIHRTVEELGCKVSVPLDQAISRTIEFNTR
jgi:nucleoside-diphosphate-sugar epimerase